MGSHILTLIYAALVSCFPAMYHRMLKYTTSYWHFGFPMAYMPNTDASQLALMIRLYGAVTVLENKNSGVIRVNKTSSFFRYAYVSYLCRGNGVLLMSPLMFPCSVHIIDNFLSLYRILSSTHEPINMKLVYWLGYSATFLMLMCVLPSGYNLSLIFGAFLGLTMHYNQMYDDCIFHDTNKMVGDKYIDSDLLMTNNYNLVYCQHQQCIYELPNEYDDIEVVDGYITSCRIAMKDT